MNFRKLKGKLKEEDFTQKEIAELLGITPQAFNAKINNRVQFTLGEVIEMTNILKIDNPIEIFFNFFVAFMKLYFILVDIGGNFI